MVGADMVNEMSVTFLPIDAVDSPRGLLTLAAAKASALAWLLFADVNTFFCYFTSVAVHSAGSPLNSS